MTKATEGRIECSYIFVCWVCICCQCVSEGLVSGNCQLCRRRNSIAQRPADTRKKVWLSFAKSLDRITWQRPLKAEWNALTFSFVRSVSTATVRQWVWYPETASFAGGATVLLDVLQTQEKRSGWLGLTIQEKERKKATEGRMECSYIFVCWVCICCQCVSEGLVSGNCQLFQRRNSIAQCPADTKNKNVMLSLAKLLEMTIQEREKKATEGQMECSYIFVSGVCICCCCASVSLVSGNCQLCRRRNSTARRPADTRKKVWLSFAKSLDIITWQRPQKVEGNAHTFSFVGFVSAANVCQRVCYPEAASFAGGATGLLNVLQTQEQGSDLIYLRLTWREMENLIFEDFLSHSWGFLKIFWKIWGILEKLVRCENFEFAFSLCLLEVLTTN